MSRTLEQALHELAELRPELGLEADGGSGLPSLEGATGAQSPILERWLADTDTLAQGIDRKTAAAYLLSILVWRLGEILGSLYLSGAALPPLSPGQVRADLTVSGSGSGRDIQLRFCLLPQGVGRPFDRDGHAASIVAIHRPLVGALYRRTALSRTALWRLVTDGMSDGLLAYGKRVGEVNRARAEAVAILRKAPLYNRQWSFAEIGEPNGPGEWFRLRGGCCRLYKSEGADFCTTCVLRRREDQIARLQDYVRGRQGRR